jgi:transposase
MPKRTRKRTRAVIGGVDTHGRTHHAAVIDQQGRLLGDREFPADSGGYRQLLSWLGRHGQLDAVGVEGTGSYGAGLTRLLLDRPTRSLEHQMTARALQVTARRLQQLRAEINTLQHDIQTLVAAVAPWLLELPGVGPITAAQVLISWSHAGRWRSEAAFAALAGTRPIPASSGQVTRHRLSRSGDRQLNRALHTIAVVRLRDDPLTRAYAQRRTAQGKKPREIKGCLKRIIARQLYKLLERYDRLRAGGPPVTRPARSPRLAGQGTATCDLRTDRTPTARAALECFYRWVDGVGVAELSRLARTVRAWEAEIRSSGSGTASATSPITGCGCCCIAASRGRRMSSWAAEAAPRV